MAGRAVLTGPMKSDTARRMRRTAQMLAETHPEMVTSGHLRDAAKVLEHGSVEGAKRHLDAAMETLVPRNLYRHGITDDEGHAQAKTLMHQINRHRLAVMDIEDAHGRNRQIMANRAMQRAGQHANQVPDVQPPAAAQLSNVDLSARTAVLERTPAPRGKPGGPGLYDVSGMGHSPYFQQVVKALIEKRGMTPAKAYPIAYAALRKWRRGGGGVHPEVQAAASGSLASEAAKGAAARAMHGHANGSGGIELAFNPAELRSPGGEWMSGPHAVRPFRYQGPPGGFGHIRAIETAGDKYSPHGELRPGSPPGGGSEVLRTSLRSAARFLAMRQLDHASRALDMADWAARHTGPQAQLDVRAIRRSLAGVPRAVGPIHYPPGPHVASNPLRIMGYSGASSWGQIDLAVELAAQAGGAGGSGGQGQGKGKQGQKQNNSRPQSSNWQNETRVQAGSPAGGQFGSGGGGGQQAKGKGKGSKQARAARKAQLQKKAAGIRAQIRALQAAYRAAVASSKHTTSRKAAKAGKATSPAAAAAAAKKATAAKSKTATPRKKTAKALSPAQIHGKIIALRAVLSGIVAQIHSLANDQEAIDLAAWEHELRGPDGRFMKAGGSGMRTTGTPMLTTASPAASARWQNRVSSVQVQGEVAQARKVAAETEQKLHTAEGHKHRVKLAVHAGLIVAGGILAVVLAHIFGGSEAVGAIGAGTPLLVQEIIDAAKKL